MMVSCASSRAAVATSASEASRAAGGATSAEARRDEVKWSEARVFVWRMAQLAAARRRATPLARGRNLETVPPPPCLTSAASFWEPVHAQEPTCMTPWLSLVMIELMVRRPPYLCTPVVSS